MKRTLNDNFGIERYGDVCEVNEELIIEDVKEFIKELKEELESEKYMDDEYNAHQSFLRGECSKIIDRLTGDIKNE